MAENLNIGARSEQNLSPEARFKTKQSVDEDEIGHPTIEQAKYKAEELEKALVMCKNNPHTRDDIETIKWLEVELKIWQRLAEGKPIEGETEDDFKEYIIHVNKMS